MAEPAASDAARILYEAMDPAFTTGDEGREWVALKLCMALTAGGLSKVFDYVIPKGDGEPWELVLDPATCPVEVLPWLAQFDGAVLLPSMTDAEKRATIIAPATFERGTVRQIIEVAKRRLTGTKTVTVTERYTGDAWKIQVKTIAGETPEEAATKADIEREAKPIGILLFMNAASVWSWKTMRETVEFNTWLKVREKAATWLAVRTHE